MVQLAEPHLEVLRWLGHNENNFTEAWLEYDRPYVMFLILERIGGVGHHQVQMLFVTMLDAPIEGGREAWDLIPDKHFAQQVRDVRDGKLDWSQEDELSAQAGQVVGDAFAEAWNEHEVSRKWMIGRIHKEIPDLQAWIDGKSKESE